MNYLVPVILLLSVLFAALKKISVYDSFVEGAKEAVRLTLSVLPYLVGIFVMTELFSVSGLAKQLSFCLEPLFSVLGIPSELIELIILRPLSGSGSLVVTEKIFAEYGVDSYVGRCASVLCGSSDTVFYIVSVYLSKSENKKSGAAVPIALFSTFSGTILSCFLCRYL